MKKLFAILPLAALLFACGSPATQEVEVEPEVVCEEVTEEEEVTPAPTTPRPATPVKKETAPAVVEKEPEAAAPGTTVEVEEEAVVTRENAPARRR